MATISAIEFKSGTLSPQEIKVLEQTRSRLAQLTTSLASLQQHIINSDPLPPWSSLHSLSQITSQHLASVSSNLTANAEVLSSLAAYPLPNYPGREQEPILHQLLRKKLEPHVQDWVDEGIATGENIEHRDETTELWEWAGMAANEEARKHDWDRAEFTLEERDSGSKNVVTGLREGVHEENDSGEEDEEDNGEKEVGQDGLGSQAMAMDDVLRFLVKGEQVGG